MNYFNIIKHKDNMLLCIHQIHYFEKHQINLHGKVDCMQHLGHHLWRQRYPRNGSGIHGEATFTTIRRSLVMARTGESLGHYSGRKEKLFSKCSCLNITIRSKNHTVMKTLRLT